MHPFIELQVLGQLGQDYYMKALPGMNILCVASEGVILLESHKGSQNLSQHQLKTPQTYHMHFAGPKRVRIRGWSLAILSSLSMPIVQTADYWRRQKHHLQRYCWFGT